MKTLKHTIFLLLTLTFLNANSQTFQHESLTKLWSSKEGLKTPESALIDKSSGTIYVANINEKPWEKDSNGFISKLSLNGDIVTLEWAKGLSAPKGMGISNGKLYVTDVDELVEINLKDGSVIKKYTHAKAQNLNDITVGNDGTVYVSDSKGSCIFYFVKNNMEVLIELETGIKTNGLLFDNGKLLLGQTDRLASLDLKTKKVTALVEGTGFIDGIAAIGDGSYIVSLWSGNVKIVQPGKPILLILDTASEKINSADIDFDPKSKILYVPTFFDNHIVAYQLKK